MKTALNISPDLQLPVEREYLMLWDNSDPNFHKPVCYGFEPLLDRLLWERDPNREEPFHASWYYDSAEFLTRYGNLKSMYYPYMYKSAYKQDKYEGRQEMYSCAFKCLCAAWREEDGKYY